MSTSTTPMLLKTVQSKKLQPEKLITHRFPFEDMLQAYDVFENSAKTEALKLIISEQNSFITSVAGQVGYVSLAFSM